MEREIENMLDAFADMRSQTKADAVLGAPVSAEGRTLIPVADVAYTFEMEGGQLVRAGRAGESAPSSSGRGCATTRPLAVLEVTPEATRVRPVADRQLAPFWKSAFAGWLGFWLFTGLVRLFSRRR